jgi:hypothetical protein
MHSYTAQQLTQVVPTKKQMHEALLRNAYVVPDLKSPIVTKDFMALTRQRQIYSFKTDQVKLFNCVSPPTLNFLQGELVNALQNNLHRFPATDKVAVQRLIVSLRNRQADKRYYVLMLGTVTNGQHPIFAKDYVAPKRKPQNEVTFNENSDFFEGLPEYQGQVRRSHVTSLMLTAEQRRELRVQQLNARIRAYQRQVDVLRPPQQQEAQVSMLRDLNETMERLEVSTQMGSNASADPVPNVIINEDADEDLFDE